MKGSPHSQSRAAIVPVDEMIISHFMMIDDPILLLQASEHQVTPLSRLRDDTMYHVGREALPSVSQLT